ncbi:MAG: hypothetical protein SLAVMIC_00281 [uncultured marine phage]|uniref:Uncharacterized protein n=1 Tax=uncultured marine phage TaxID=707152 RepID=A0A8D9FQM3_9VIRU|nr:MAG: hypothetical protein SLAVMIC_00281 [uncultured marine phage]
MKHLRTFESYQEEDLEVGDRVSIEYPDRTDHGDIIEVMDNGDYKIRDEEGHVFPAERSRLTKL